MTEEQNERVERAKRERREQAEKEYHDRLKNIDTEVSASVERYAARLKDIEESQRRVNAAFEKQKDELAAEYGLFVAEPVAAKPALNSPTKNP